MANNNTNATGILELIDYGAGSGQGKQGIAVKAFALNIAVGIVLFTFEFSGFLLLKSAGIGRRIYQPKSYLVQHRLRVEAIPVNPIKWLRRIVGISDEELKAKCGLDGYFFIRLIRAMLIIFVPLTILVVTVLLPINYHDGAFSNVYTVSGHREAYNVTGLDTLSWQNVAPTQSRRYWAHLVCAVVAIGWTLYRIFREKVNFIETRQRFLTSPEQRLKASARTVLITNIPAEFRSKDALESLFDVFVDNDDHTRLTVWVNRDYGKLRALTAKRSSLRHALEKAELKILRDINKKYKGGAVAHTEEELEPTVSSATESEDGLRDINAARKVDCEDEAQLWRRYGGSAPEITVTRSESGELTPLPAWKFWVSGEKISKLAWLRSEIAQLTVKIEEMLQHLDDEERFPRQNSAFIQFDRQMAAQMACSLVSHHKYGRMAPRFLGVAPHEVLWPNMGVTSLWRIIRTLLAFVLFLAILFLWGLPTAFLSVLSQLDALRGSTSWLEWLKPWPSWVISLISGPLASILLALLIQLVVPALMRKLAVLVGVPTRSQRELTTQNFYFAFLFIELVLVTSISSGIVNVIPVIVSNPTNIPSILANNLPKAANYFFNYLIIQCLGFSGSVLFQYLRILYITTIWPWFTQTPREEAFLQTTIPHQMWANAYGLMTNFGVIALIYCIISPLMLIIVCLTFSLLWVAYRHNYYYVQRNKIDTHGLLFNQAISHLFAGVYTMEIALIGLFFLVRNADGDVVCSAQAIIMIIVAALTAIFHFIMERTLRPLYDYLPVTLEDPAADAERERFLTGGQADTNGKPSTDVPRSEKLSGETEQAGKTSTDALRPEVSTGEEAEKPGKAKHHKKGLYTTKSTSATAAAARKTLARLTHDAASRISHSQNPASDPHETAGSRRRELADQLGAALESFPDELADLTPKERVAELRAAFQDPVTRELKPVIWLPQDAAGVADDTVRRVRGIYGQYLEYSDAGAFLSPKNKCEVVRPAPDVRPDWLLDWVL